MGTYTLHSPFSPGFLSAPPTLTQGLFPPSLKGFLLVLIANNINGGLPPFEFLPFSAKTSTCNNRDLLQGGHAAKTWLRDSDWTNRGLLSRFEGVLGKLARVTNNVDVSLLTAHVKEAV